MMIIYIASMSIINCLLRLILCQYYSLLVITNDFKGPWGTIVDADMSGTLVRILAVPDRVV